ncbi:ABC transporter ATP-binding protein [Paenibacillus glufosinatiresistens]|uniref:ABC transporter ATP-binding protein n=1 Tax=Paenibacillus glufosinatiresistens TaxID=3070657 RepID=UPI00286DFD26|nr:ABC transporter ATP-binding protein [Paenibacillus sp. YX.27]
MNNNASIEFKDVSLRFRIYSDKGLSIKESIINRVRRKNYADKVKEFWVLQHLNLSIEHGDRLGIIGNNGAGKSTMLKLISKIYEPTQGTIDVSGRVVPLIELGAGFNPELTGRENIYLNGAVLGYTKEEMKSLEKNIIEFSELKDFIDIPIKYYSTGMYARLAFTVATEVQPEILIIDEIFAGGDINFVDRAVKRINNLIDSAQIVIMVSHSLGLIKDVCNRCIVIADHGVAFDGKVDDAIKYYQSTNGH